MHLLLFSLLLLVQSGFTFSSLGSQCKCSIPLPPPNEIQTTLPQLRSTAIPSLTSKGENPLIYKYRRLVDTEYIEGRDIIPGMVVLDPDCVRITSTTFSTEPHVRLAPKCGMPLYRKLDTGFLGLSSTYLTMGYRVNDSRVYQHYKVSLPDIPMNAFETLPGGGKIRYAVDDVSFFKSVTVVGNETHRRFMPLICEQYFIKVPEHGRLPEIDPKHFRLVHDVVHLRVLDEDVLALCSHGYWYPVDYFMTTAPVPVTIKYEIQSSHDWDLVKPVFYRTDCAEHKNRLQDQLLFSGYSPAHIFDETISHCYVGTTVSTANYSYRTLAIPFVRRYSWWESILMAIIDELTDLMEPLLEGIVKLLLQALQGAFSLLSKFMTSRTYSDILRMFVKLLITLLKFVVDVLATIIILIMYRHPFTVFLPLILCLSIFCIYGYRLAAVMAIFISVIFGYVVEVNYEI